MPAELTDDQIAARVRGLLAAAVAGLDPADRAERDAYCRRTGDHEAHHSREGGLLVFRWGGSTLLAIDIAALLDPDADAGLEFVPAPPDDARDLTGSAAGETSPP
ncbi:hypothetical protein ACQP2K_30645 [Microbispora siamensis]